MLIMGSKKYEEFLKGCNYKVINQVDIYETEDYSFFELDPKNNRSVKKGSHYKKLKKSIEELGIINPVLVLPKKIKGQNKGVIVSGQHRYEACKDLGIPVKFIIVDKNNYSTIMQFILDNTTLPNVAGEFIEIGASRGYKVCKLILQLMKDYGEYFNGITVPLETVMTYFKNHNEQVFHIKPFKDACSESVKKTEAVLKELKQIKVYPDDVHSIYDYIDTLVKITMAIGRGSISVNFNREMLKLLSTHKELEITPLEIYQYFSTENEEEKNIRERLKKDLAQVYASSSKNIRNVLKEIEQRILTQETKKDRREVRIDIKTISEGPDSEKITKKTTKRSTG